MLLHNLNNMYYQIPDTPQTIMLLQNTLRECFGATIKICTLQNPEILYYHTALIAEDFVGNLIGKRQKSGYHRANGSTGGAYLAFEWAKKMQHINVEMEAQDMTTIVGFNLLYNKVIEGRFKTFFSYQGNFEDTTTTHIFFVLLNLKLLCFQSCYGL